MFPILFNLPTPWGDFPVHGYGFFIALGFICGIFYARYLAKKQGLPTDKITDLGFWALLVGMIGCRIIFIFTQLPEYLKNPIEIFYVWEGGMVFWGGPLLNIPFFLWYTKKHNLPRAQVLDIGAIVLPLGHAIGRIGCLSAGCCYGKPTTLPWGIELKSPAIDLYSLGQKLHPTQIYEAAALFMLFIVLQIIDKRKSFMGQTSFAYLFLYSIERSIVEVFRGDSIRGYVIDGWVSTSQFLSFIVILFSTYFYLRLREK